jgi:peptide-methionine (S)-S-oxide reductase
MPRTFLGSALGSAAALGAGLAAVLTFGGRGASAAPAAPLSPPALDVAHDAKPGEQVAVFSGGCFWGVQAVFAHVRGVTSATSGYTGGSARTANYEEVSAGSTGHAESVRVTYDPSRVSYGQLLRVFFGVAHDPTQLNRQGPDRGTQYRSAVWYVNAEQERVVRAYIEQLTREKAFERRIVTQVAPLGEFYPAEAYHQDYAFLHPDAPYIVIHDRPKIEHLRRALPELFVETPVRYAAAEQAR